MRSKILTLFYLLIPFGLIANGSGFETNLTKSLGEEGKEVFVTPIPKSDLHLLDSADYQIINSANSGSSYFLDEVNHFLLDFNSVDIDASSISKVWFHLNGDSLQFNSLTPFMVTGHLEGKNTIVLKDQDFSPIKFRTNEKGTLVIKTIEEAPLFKNDAIVLGILLLILAVIFYTSGLPSFKKFYTFVPSLLLCYFVPAIFNSLGIISGEHSKLYFVASRYLLPASLILLCLSIDLKEIFKLGPKALIMFLTGTLGIVIGGPLALMIIAAIAPDWLGADAGDIWRGLSTVAGSWIGGGANQTAMKEIFKTPDAMFSKMIVVDVIVANIWMAVLLYGAGISRKLDQRFKADSSAIESLKTKMQNFVSGIKRTPTTTDIMVIAGIGIVGTGIAHFGADVITPVFDGMKEKLEAIGLSSLASGFFWLIVFATVIGVLLSFSKMKNYEGAGASKIGSVFLYILVATIGTHMDIGAIAESPILFAIGGIWMLIHAIIMLVVAKLIRAPFFFVAVGSQANVGGAASAPIVASAFSPSLAPVGVLLAVFGYAIGTGAAWLCTILMQHVDVAV